MAEAATAKRLCGKQPKISPRQEERIRSTLAHGPSDSPSTDPPSAAREKRPGHRGLGLLAEPLPTPHLPATQRHRTDFPVQDQPSLRLATRSGVPGLQPWSNREPPMSGVLETPVGKPL